MMKKKSEVKTASFDLVGFRCLRRSLLSQLHPLLFVHRLWVVRSVVLEHQGTLPIQHYVSEALDNHIKGIVKISPQSGEKPLHVNFL